ETELRRPLGLARRPRRRGGDPGGRLRPRDPRGARHHPAGRAAARRALGPGAAAAAVPAGALPVRLRGGPRCGEHRPPGGGARRLRVLHPGRGRPDDAALPRAPPAHGDRGPARGRHRLPVAEPGPGGTAGRGGPLTASLDRGGPGQRARMRVVVVGGTGNIGTSVISALAADPAVTSILGVARRRPDWHPDKTEWATADVAVDDLAPLFAGADAVVHL